MLAASCKKMFKRREKKNRAPRMGRIFEYAPRTILIIYIFWRLNTLAICSVCKYYAVSRTRYTARWCEGNNKSAGTPERTYVAALFLDGLQVLTLESLTERNYFFLFEFSYNFFFFWLKLLRLTTILICNNMK